MIKGGAPLNKHFTPGYENPGTITALGPGVDELEIGDRVTVEIHAGCGQCKRCRMDMYTSCHNYCLNYGNVNKGPRANEFTTDGGFKEYAINNVNTMIKVPDDLSDEEATLVVTAGTSMYGLTELGGLVAGESVVVIGPGPIGLLAISVAKSLGASPVVLVGTRENRNKIGEQLGADITINAREEDAIARVMKITGKWADYVVDCEGTELTVNQAVTMTNRGGRVCLAAFPKDAVKFDIGHLAVNYIYLYGIRGEGRSATHRAMALMADNQFDASLIHTHTFPMEEIPEALRHARERVDDAIKVVVSMRQSREGKVAAE